MGKTSTNSRAAAALLSLLALAVVPGAKADEPDDGEEVVTRHLSDSSTDRIPAITAFPKYPVIARRDRIEGEAIVCFTIDVDGSVRRPKIQRSTHKIFRDPAMRAIRASSFEPLARGQTLNGSRTCRTYRFRLDPITASTADPDL